MQRILVFLALFAWTGIAHAQTQQGTISTLSLDGLSFISFENLETYQIPSGASIKFHFAPSGSGSSIGFTIQPQDVVIPPIKLSSGEGTLQYTLAGPASGTMTVTGGTATIDMTATISASLSGPDGGGSVTYPLHFTTQTASAPNSAGTKTVSVTGAPVVRSAGYVQLVAATTNKPQASPEPGRAVYTVLSGSFDHLP